MWPETVWHALYRCVVSEHFTLRLHASTAARLRDRAGRVHAAPRTLAQRYVDEGLRHDDHPVIHFMDGATGRRARVIGSGLDVWEVIATVRDNDNDQVEAADYLQVPRGVVQAAVAYYGDFRDEIDSEIADNVRAWNDGQAAVQRGQRALEG